MPIFGKAFYLFDFAGFFPPQQYRTDRLLGGGLLAFFFRKPKVGQSAKQPVRPKIGEVNLSDFCRYYQQPTNNTPELALRIGSRLQNLLLNWPFVFRFADSLYSKLPLSLFSPLIVISQRFAAILVLFVGRTG